MMSKKRIWSPEEINDMRERVKTASFREVGELYGVSRETVRLLVGSTDRRRQPPGPPPGGQEETRRKVAELFGRGLTDQQIAAELGLAVNTVRHRRWQLGIRRLNPNNGVEHAYDRLRRWVDVFGYVPAAGDWNPQMARLNGQERRALRFEEFRERFGCPHTNSVQKRHGSWADFIEGGGYPRPHPGSRSSGWRTAPLLSELEDGPADS